MDKNFKLIRGERVLQILEEDSTPSELFQNIVTGFPKTRKRQHATQSVSISNVRYTPYVENGTLLVEATATNEGKKYTPTILFNDVAYEAEDTPTNTTFLASNNEEYNILPIKLKDNTVKVRCTCLDFYHRFSTWNFQDDSLYGPKPPPYRRKTITRPPANPMRVPGLCKHLIKLTRTLRGVKIVVS